MGPKRRRIAGILSVEAVIGLSMLMVVFIIVLVQARQLWTQMLAEQGAADLARSAARVPMESGTRAYKDLPGGGLAEVEWTEEFVVVRVQQNAVYSSVSAMSASPREVP